MDYISKHGSSSTASKLENKQNKQNQMKRDCGRLGRACVCVCVYSRPAVSHGELVSEQMDLAVFFLGAELRNDLVQDVNSMV